MGWRRPLAALRGRGTNQRDPDVAAVELARAASRAKDWPAAAAAWTAVTGSPKAADLGVEPWVELGRAHRLCWDLEAALLAVEQGRAAAPDDLSLTVEHARTALRGYTSSEEDERHRWKALLLSARAQLKASRDRGEVSKPALRTAGDIELALRRWQDAVELFEQLGSRYPDRRDEAALQRARALGSAGDLAGARAAFQLVGPATAAGSAATELSRAISRAERRELTDEAFRSASARWHAGEPGVLHEAIAQALTDRLVPVARVDRLRPLLVDLEAFLDEAAHGGHEPRGAPAPVPEEGLLDAREVVVVSGFLYSGSGAIFDLLRGYPRFHLPFDDREPGFLKKPGHLATIVEYRGGARLPDPPTVADAILASTFGFGQTGRPLLRWVRSDDALTDRLVAQLRWLVAELREIWADRGTDHEEAEPAVAAAVRTLLDAVIATLTPPGRVALLNNPVIGHELHRIRLLSSAVAVPVLRDPRDQFVSQHLESPYALSCEDFVTMMRERYRAIAVSLSDETLAPRVIPVRFEGFVEEPEDRARLLERLGIDPEARTDRTFRPERSRRNIAIHRDHPDQAEIARIADALLDPFEALTETW